jgi:hypothetical protein
MDTLQSLGWTPLTAKQLTKVSRSFDQSYPTEEKAQRRLRSLRDAGLVRGWRYATTEDGSGPLYYKPTLESYRSVYGDHAVVPTKRFLQEIAIGRHQHTRSISDFIVHTTVSADDCGIAVTDFHPENTERITVDGSTLFPDARFSLQTSRETFCYRLEMDGSTESVNSTTSLHAWRRKLELYYQHAALNHNRYKLLVVTIKNSTRLPHILELAAQLNPNRAYSLVYGITLDDYLVENDPLSAPCFLNERCERIPLLRGLADHAADSPTNR